MKKTIICLGSGYSQIPLIKTAKKMGMKVIVVDRNANTPGFKLSELQINESLEDIDKIIEVLLKEGDIFEIKPGKLKVLE